MIEIRLDWIWWSPITCNMAGVEWCMIGIGLDWIWWSPITCNMAGVE